MKDFEKLKENIDKVKEIIGSPVISTTETTTTIKPE